MNEQPYTIQCDTCGRPVGTASKPQSGYLCHACYTPAEPERLYAKLDIRRAMRSIGMEDALDAMLDSDPKYRKDWDTATVFTPSDPMYVKAFADLNFDPAPILAMIQPLEK